MQLTSATLTSIDFAITAQDDANPADSAAQKNARFTVNTDWVRSANSDELESEEAFAKNWTGGVDNVVGGISWKRASRLGQTAYVVETAQALADATLVTVPFTVSASIPLSIELVHDYNLVREPANSFRSGSVEIRVDGDDWGNLYPYLSNCGCIGGGSSGGWRTDTFDLGMALAGHQVQLRLRFAANDSAIPQPIHWAISHIAINGAATPPFSRPIAHFVHVNGFESE